MSGKIPSTHSLTRVFLMGSRDSAPLVIAAMPFAIAYGALAAANSMAPMAIVAMSLLVFAGASQLVAVLLFASATALPVILLTVFIVNLRHALYSISLMPKVAQLPQWLRAAVAFVLTDETYAVVANKLPYLASGNALVAYYLGSGLTMYSAWVLCSAIGMVIGQEIPDFNQYGLDVAMVVAFTAIVVPMLRNLPRCACAFTAAFCIVFVYDWPQQTGLLVSTLLGVAVGLLLESRKSPHKEKSCQTSNSP